MAENKEQERPLQNIFAVEKEYKSSPEEDFIRNMNSQMSDPATEHEKYGGADVPSYDKAVDRYAYNLFAPDSMKNTAGVNAQIADEYLGSMATNAMADLVGGAVGGKIGSKIKNRVSKKGVGSEAVKNAARMPMSGPDTSAERIKIAQGVLEGNKDYEEGLKKVARLASDDYSKAAINPAVDKEGKIIGEKIVDIANKPLVDINETIDSWAADVAKQTKNNIVEKGIRLQEAGFPFDLQRHIYGMSKMNRDLLKDERIIKELKDHGIKVTTELKNALDIAMKLHDLGKLGIPIESIATYIDSWDDATPKALKEIFKDRFNPDKITYLKQIDPHNDLSYEVLKHIPEFNIKLTDEGDTIASLALNHDKRGELTTLEKYIKAIDTNDAAFTKRVYKKEQPELSDVLGGKYNDIRSFPDYVQEAFAEAALKNTIQNGVYNGIPDSPLTAIFENARINQARKDLYDMQGKWTNLGKSLETASTAAGAAGANIAKNSTGSIWQSAKNFVKNVSDEHKARVSIYDTVRKGFPGVKGSNERKINGFGLDNIGIDYDTNVAGFLKEDGLKKCYDALVRMNENLQKAKISDVKKQAVQTVIDNWSSLSDADKVYLLRQIAKNPTIKRVINGKDYQY